VSGASDMKGAREEILRRVGAALRATPTPEPVVRDYRRGGAADRDALVELLRERLVDYKAEVRRVAAGEVGRAIAEVCRERRVRRLGVPPGLPGDWRPDGVTAVDEHGVRAADDDGVTVVEDDGVTVVEDDGLGPHELDALDGVVTGCTLAIAETGTLVLTAGPTEGRRALTLVPDLYVCVVDESQVVSDLPTAIPEIAGLVRAEGRPVTFISGPSATSDIELHRVEGVHGPRQLVVLIVTTQVGLTA
jgi:L-lactate dehydrogenase complex protein LldG